MLAYAIILTMLFGMLMGAVLTVIIAVRWDERDKAKAAAKKHHPSNQDAPDYIPAWVQEK
jgi:hypothetical protein